MKELLERLEAKSLNESLKYKLVKGDKVKAKVDVPGHLKPAGRKGMRSMLGRKGVTIGSGTVVKVFDMMHDPWAVVIPMKGDLKGKRVRVDMDRLDDFFEE